MWPQLNERAREWLNVSMRECVVSDWLRELVSDLPVAIGLAIDH